MEGEFAALLATVTEERARLTTETAHLNQEQSRLRAESVRVEQERQRLERDRASLVEKLHRAESSGQEATRLNQVRICVLYVAKTLYFIRGCSRQWSCRERVGR